MKSFLFFALLIVSNAAFSQKIFNVYDSYTLALIDSVTITSNKNKTEILDFSKGIYKVTNLKEGTSLTFTKSGYQKHIFKSPDNQAESCQIFLEPDEALMSYYRTRFAFYAPLSTSSANEKNTDKVNDTNSDKGVSEPAAKEKDDSILMIVAQPAQFPGGQPALKKYLQENLQYPQEALDLNICGKVYLQFIVSAKGKISNVRIVKGMNLPMDMESYNVIKEMPDWIPGYQDGKPVNSYFNLPINFKLQ